MKDIFFTNGDDKLPTLKKLNSAWHFDDYDSDIQSEMRDIEKAGIKVTNTFIPAKWDEYMNMMNRE